MSYKGSEAALVRVVWLSCPFNANSLAMTTMNSPSHAHLCAYTHTYIPPTRSADALLAAGESTPVNKTICIHQAF